MKGWWFLVLRGLYEMMASLPDWECKTIGYADRPAKWHCGSCTMAYIREEIKAAVDFWADKYKDSIS